VTETFFVLVVLLGEKAFMTKEQIFIAAGSAMIWGFSLRHCCSLKFCGMLAVSNGGVAED